jgi:site-specific DNA-methyltransferase (cytosine-N4-specific)
MLDAMRSAHSLMKPGAACYYIVGNNSTHVNGSKLEIPTDRFLFILGAYAAWTPVEQIPMELISSRDIFRENRGTSETILCFKA